jgi:hypothetical protein
MWRFWDVSWRLYEENFLKCGPWGCGSAITNRCCSHRCQRVLGEIFSPCASTTPLIRMICPLPTFLLFKLKFVHKKNILNSG